MEVLDRPPVRGWKIGKDSFSKAVVYFKDDNVRTFWSIDWRSRFAPRSREQGLQGLRSRIVMRFKQYARVILIIDIASNSIIEKYQFGELVEFDSRHVPNHSLNFLPEMKKVKALYNRLNPTQDSSNQNQSSAFVPFRKLYPEADLFDKKTHVLFISPCLNASGYYRMLTPYFELNKTATHAALVSNLHLWSFDKMFEEYDHAHDDQLWAWADIVVFPPVFVPLAGSLDKARSINPDLQFVMDLDLAFHQIPDALPGKEQFDQQRLQSLLENLRLMKTVTSPSTELNSYYQSLLAGAAKCTTLPEFELVPNLLSSTAFEDLRIKSKKDQSKIRIGLLGTAGSALDMEEVLPVLKQIKSEYRSDIEIVIYGWNGRVKDQSTSFESLNFTFERPVKFTSYFGKLSALTLDLVLLPMQNSPYNQCKSFVKYLEMAAFQVPVVASFHSPYNDVITNGVNGFLADSNAEWMHWTKYLIENEDLRKQIGGEAYRTAWGHYAYSKENIQILTNIYTK